MARPSGEGTFEILWRGGLNTSEDKAKIGQDELSDGSNFIVRDGSVRLDRRYILGAEAASGDLAPNGSGWGRYGSDEQYVVILAGVGYLINLNAPLAFTAISGAGTLNNSNWLTQQLGQYIYFGNATDGLARKKVAAGSNGTGDFEFITQPTAPTTAPLAPMPGPAEDWSFLGSTIAASGSASTSYSSGTDAWTIDYAVASPGTYTVEITFDTAPDLRPDWSYIDNIRFLWYGGSIGGFGRPRIYTIDGSSNVNEMTFWRNGGAGPTSGSNYTYYRMAGIPRSERTQVAKLRFVFPWTGSAAMNLTNDSIVFYAPTTFKLWLSVESTINVGEGFPALAPLNYAYTYYNSTSGVESAPSPIRTVPAAVMNPYGAWALVTGATTAQSGIDFLRYYRVVDGVYYRLGAVANSGTPTFTDKYPLDLVLGFDVFKPSIVPTSGVTAMTVWQNRFVVGVGSVLYISRNIQSTNDELVFEPLGAAFDETDPDRGLTIYPDDKQAEVIRGLVGQDALYIITDQSVRTLFGNSPDNWRLNRLPESEGACGVRAWAAYKNGVLVLTPSGRLLYQHVSLGEPEEVSAKVRSRIDNTGIAALATSGAVVGVRPTGEIDVRSTTAYYVLDTDGTWRKGAYTHGTHSLLFVPGQVIRWIGTNGKLYTGGSDTYVTDGGTSATNGTAVTWWIQTRQELTPRIAVMNVYWGSVSDSPDPMNAAVNLYPKITITSEKGSDVVLKEVGFKSVKVVGADNTGQGLYFRIDGDKTSVLQELKMKVETESQGWHT